MHSNTPKVHQRITIKKIPLLIPNSKQLQSPKQTVLSKTHLLQNAEIEYQNASRGKEERTDLQKAFQLGLRTDKSNELITLRKDSLIPEIQNVPSFI